MSSENNPRSTSTPSPSTTYHPARENIHDLEGSNDDDSDMDYDPNEDEIEYYDAESPDGSMPDLLGKTAVDMPVLETPANA